jgi:hypothetical protein
MTLRDQTGLKLSEATRAIKTMSEHRSQHAGQRPAVEPRMNGLRLVPASADQMLAPVDSAYHDEQCFFATDVVQAALKRGALPVVTVQHDEEAAAERVLKSAFATPGVDRPEGTGQAICESVIAAFPQHLPAYIALVDWAEFLTDRELLLLLHDAAAALEGPLSDAPPCFLDEESVRVLIEAARLALSELDPDLAEEFAARAVWLRPDAEDAVELLHRARADIAKDNVAPRPCTCDETGWCLRHRKMGGHRLA